MIVNSDWVKPSYCDKNIPCSECENYEKGKVCKLKEKDDKKNKEVTHD